MLPYLYDPVLSTANSTLPKITKASLCTSSPDLLPSCRSQSFFGLFVEGRGEGGSCSHFYFEIGSCGLELAEIYLPASTFRIVKVKSMCWLVVFVF